MLEIGKDDDGVLPSATTVGKQQQQNSLLAFPDTNISSMQVEAIKKRNLVISSYR